MSSGTNICRICFKCEDLFNLSSLNCRKFFIEIIGVKNLPNNATLCLYCKTLLERFLVFLQVATESNVMLSKCNIENYSKQDKISLCASIQRKLCPWTLVTREAISIDSRNEKDKHNDTDKFIKIEHKALDPIDIESISENRTLYINTIEKKDEDEIQKQDISNEQLINSKFDSEVAIKSESREEYCKEILFDIIFLSEKEQKLEIEEKKKSESFTNTNFKCNDCGLGFLTVDVLENHLKKHELDSPYTCKICKLKFKSVHVLCQHNLAHRRRFKCQLCGFTYKRWLHCLMHRAKCGTTKELQVCGYCKKTFSDEYSFKIHVKGIHLKQKQYTCDYCNKKFRNKFKLAGHIRTHTGEKPFKCNVCHRKYSTNSNLKAHIETHADLQKAFYCVECNTYYKNAKGLKRHFSESSKHLDAPARYSCPDCPKIFKFQKSLDAHVAIIHVKKTEFKCQFCERMFSSNCNLKKHLRNIHAH